MNGLPYYKAYPRDFFEGTIGMPFELKCAYRLVLDLIYMQGGALHDEPRYISGHLGCSVRAWNSMREKLIAAGKIQVENGIISNFRADKELETLASLQEKQRQNALGPRKNKDLNKATAKPWPSHTEPEPDIGGGGGSANVRELRPVLPPTNRERLLAAMGVGPDGIAGPSKFIGTQADMAEAERWLSLPGISVDVACEEIRRLVASKRDGPPSSFRYFSTAMERLSGALTAPPLSPTAPKSGVRHERASFSAALHAAIDAAPAGSALVDRSRSDPFAKR